MGRVGDLKDAALRSVSMSAMLATTTGQCAASKNLTLSQNLPLILYTLYIYHYICIIIISYQYIALP